ncbi:transcriptional repressor [Patescibacteria group bacterium]|nr:transcriptional repressor [Patescibacteria group bacterium]
MARVAIIPNMIIELLTKNHLLSATRMLEMLKTAGENFNKTSVYRALDKLLIEDKICKQAFGDGEFVYQLRNNHRDHAVCTNCEKIIAVECRSSSNIKVSGFKINHHHTILYGLCKNCLNYLRLTK